LETNSAYILARSFGENISKEVDENDSAILAMKSWHKPLDPHHYQTALRGALAFPMLARGRLSGILLLGERRGGEAYAPDEVETFSQFAHGVGSALEALASDNRDPLAALRAAIASMQAAIIDELRAQQRPVDSQSF
jgi:GAF domain-containing protein